MNLDFAWKFDSELTPAQDPRKPVFQTVGRHSLFDQQQALNQHSALAILCSSLNDNKHLDKNLILQLHQSVAKEEALTWGEFRSGQVKIGGTHHKTPLADQLDMLFDVGFEQILSIENPIEKALVYFFWGSMNQFFYDGNKRTSRLVMNYLLMASNFYYLSIPGKRKAEFNDVMVDFYNTKNATKGMEFLLFCYKNWD